MGDGSCSAEILSLSGEDNNYTIIIDGLEHMAVSYLPSTRVRKVFLRKTFNLTSKGSLCISQRIY
jgi:hypothetical protein